MIQISIYSLDNKLSFDTILSMFGKSLVVQSRMSTYLKTISRAWSITLRSFILVLKNPQLFHYI